MKTVIISNMMRCKNKQSFFALHQIQTKIENIDPSINVEFHILWDSDASNHEKLDDPIWSNLIDVHIKNVHSYDKQFFKNYVKEFYHDVNVDKFDVWPAVYFVLMAQYLRRVKLYDYYLIYDDDVLINNDFSHILDKVLNKIPVLIAEPMNMNCDKVFFQRFLSIYGNEFLDTYNQRNPLQLGFNAGFQGVDLSVYDNFLSVDRFNFLLSLFEYKSIYGEDGEEIWGDERFYIDTQQQSFFSLSNVVLSMKEPHILDINEYFVVPNFGVHPLHGLIDSEDEFGGWGIGLTSKITHFIGNSRGKGKPKMFLDRVDEYLTNHGFNV